MKKLAAYFIKWIGFVLLWLLFVYQISRAELLTGAGAAAVAVFALEISLRAEPLMFRPQFRWFGQLWRMPATILADLWRLLTRIVAHLQRKPSPALFQKAAFHTTGKPSQQAAQRCLAVTFMSLPPNSVMVEIDTNERRMTFHQIYRAPVPTMIRKLEEWK